MTKQAVVLLSGGIDSAVTLAITQQEGYECSALIFDCGQPKEEFHAAQKLAVAATVTRYKVAEIWLPGTEKEYTFNRPGRNLIFLSYAFAWAQQWKIDTIFIGCNANDHDDYPDCRIDFLDAFASTALWSIDHVKALEIRRPLVNESKERIIKLGRSLDVDFSKTFSCYCPVEGGLSCGQCHSCIERLEGFKTAGITDPLSYVARKE